MAVKKKDKKASKRTVRNPPTPSKITLPAFGLAEDILSMQALSGPGQDAAGGERNIPNREEPDGGAEGLAQSSGGPGGEEFNGGSELHLVTFHLDTEEYGVDIGRVQEIIRVGQITPVPNAPVFIKGVINLRGKIIPVLDLRKRFDLPEAGLTKNSRIMIVETGPKVLGLLVDGVSQVLRIPTVSVEAPPEEIEQSRAFVRGIGKVNARLIMIMELDRVLAKDAQMPAAG